MSSTQTTTTAHGTSIETSRFGTIEIDETRQYTFLSPIIGFEEDARYALLDHTADSPFKWLQSMQTPELAFILTNPLYFGHHYTFELPTWVAIMLDIQQLEDAAVYTLVTIPEDAPENMTANFLAPIIFNTKTRQGVQVVLQDTLYTTRVKLLPERNS